MGQKKQGTEAQEGTAGEGPRPSLLARQGSQTALDSSTQWDMS